MDAQAFGDAHTLRKLQTVERYLQAYTTALKFQPFDLLYVDACAGSGSSMPKAALSADIKTGQQPLDGFSSTVLDTDNIIVGSAMRALTVKPPFHKYLFNDLKRANVQALNRAIDSQFSHLKDRIAVTQLDANQMLREICRSHDWSKTRAVVFIDPFGLQIDYETLKMLGRTKAVDLWYLVPVFAMYRQVSGDGQINPDGGPRVDAALGTTAWRHVVAIEESGRDLFDQPHLRSKRAVNVAWFEKVAKDRIGEAFGGRVLDETLPLGRNGIQEFSLMFAWANPSKKADELAGKLARAVLR